MKMKITTPLTIIILNIILFHFTTIGKDDINTSFESTVVLDSAAAAASCHALDLMAAAPSPALSEERGRVPQPGSQE